MNGNAIWRLNYLSFIISVLIMTLAPFSGQAQTDDELLPEPYIDAKIYLHPERPTVHEAVTLNAEMRVRGPENGFTYTHQVDERGNVTIDMQADVNAPVSDKFMHQHFELHLGKLSAGERFVLVTINGNEYRRIDYNVVDAPPPPTPTPNPLRDIVQDIMMDFSNGYENQPVRFHIHGIFTNAGSTIGDSSARLESNGEIVRVDLRVNPGEEPTREFKPFDHIVVSEPLPAGEYRAQLYVNGILAQEMELFVKGANQIPTPTPWPLPEIPIERLSFDYDNVRPQEGDMINFFVSGMFHTSDTKVTGKEIEITDEGRVILNLRVEPGPEGPEVLTRFEEMFEVGPLPQGEYTAELHINNVPIRRLAFTVWGPGLPTRQPTLPPVEVPIHELDFAIIPTVPEAGEPFEINLEGWLPTADTRVHSPFVEYVNNEVWLNLQVENWDQGPEVLTKFSQSFEIQGLRQGRHPLKLYVNGAFAAETSFTVGDEPVLSNYGPFRSHFVIDSDQPTADEPFNILFKATFPTEGYGVIDRSLSREGNSIVAEVGIVEPQNPVAQVITPVEIDMGELTLDAGVYELKGVVNGVELAPMRFQVIDPDEGVRPLLNYTREGGFAGTYSWVNLHKGEYFSRLNPFTDDGIERGRVPADVWDEFFNLMNAMDWQNMPEGFPAEGEEDVPIADGFIHTISYEDNSVFVHDGYEIPDELNRALEMLQNTFLNELPPSDVDRDLTGEETSVSEWVNHN